MTMTTSCLSPPLLWARVSQLPIPLGGEDSIVWLGLFILSPSSDHLIYIHGLIFTKVFTKILLYLTYRISQNERKVISIPLTLYGLTGVLQSGPNRPLTSLPLSPTSKVSTR